MIYQPLNNCATVTITHLGLLVIQGHRVLRSTVKRFQIQKEAILSPFSFALPRSVLNYFMLATTDWCLVVTQVLSILSQTIYSLAAILCNIVRTLKNQRSTNDNNCPYGAHAKNFYFVQIFQKYGER